MHRPPSFRRRSYAPQLCAAGAFLVLLLLSLSILHIRLSSSPHTLPLPSIPNSSHLLPDDPTDDLTDDPILLDDGPNPLTPPADADDTPPTLFWDHSLSVARISFRRPATTSPPHHHPIPPLLSFASDDEPLHHSLKSQLSSIRHIEDALFIEDSPLRDRWAKWLEKKRDFIRRDRMLRSDAHELLNPRNHPLLRDPDVAGSAGLTRGDRMVRKAVLMGMEGVDLESGFSEFVDRFFHGGRCGIRVFMVWNSPSWSFGVRHRRGVESVLYHHRNACVLLFSETVELDFFKEFVNDG